MSEKMRPRLPIPTERIFRRTENVIDPGEHRDGDTNNGDHLRRDIQKSDDGKKLLVTPEAASVNMDRVVDDGYPSQSRHAEPLRGGVGDAAERHRQPG